MLHMKCTCGVIWLMNISFKRTLDRDGKDNSLRSDGVEGVDTIFGTPNDMLLRLEMNLYALS